MEYEKQVLQTSERHRLFYISLKDELFIHSTRIDCLLCAMCCPGCRRDGADLADGSLPSGNLQPNSGQSPGTLRGLKGQTTEARCVKQNGNLDILEHRISPSDHVVTVFA